ncbi:MAG TPA: AAC(3) family N-acetyltransferase [Nitrolancea sp.]|nr:AAC(3) family N-acetyltransferase [Nitrolancea sp.]
MNHSTVTTSQIQQGIRVLQLSGRPLCVHSSLRSFGWLQDGAATVIDGILSEGCTLLVPTFTSHFDVAPPAGRRRERNGFDDANEQPGNVISGWYTSDSTLINGEMGALPRTLLGMQGRWRGLHPHDSFSAIGPAAAELIQDQRPLHVYAPFEALVRLDGWVVLMGVGLDRMTLIHYAEQRAGREPFRRWSRDQSGEIIESQVGGCSDGFERLSGPLAALERTTEVGGSHWRAYPAGAFVELAAQVIRTQPDITHCANPNCLRCNDAISGGPIGIGEAR